MRPVDVIRGTMVTLPRADIDTDQIIPQKHLKGTDRTGYGPYAFDNWARDDEGIPRDDFILNHPERQEARVLVTGANFGCGSSREHAVWALVDRGFEAVIASSFADIFRANAVNNGLLTVTLPESGVDTLHGAAAHPGTEVEISLSEQTVRCEGETWRFEIDPESRTRLLAGLDPIAVTLGHDQAITAFEADRPNWLGGLRAGQ